MTTDVQRDTCIIDLYIYIYTKILNVDIRYKDKGQTCVFASITRLTFASGRSNSQSIN